MSENLSLIEDDLIQLSNNNNDFYKNLHIVALFSYKTIQSIIIIYIFYSIVFK